MKWAIGSEIGDAEGAEGAESAVGAGANGTLRRLGGNGNSTGSNIDEGPSGIANTLLESISKSAVCSCAAMRFFRSDSQSQPTPTRTAPAPYTAGCCQRVSCKSCSLACSCKASARAVWACSVAACALALASRNCARPAMISSGLSCKVSHICWAASRSSPDSLAGPNSRLNRKVGMCASKPASGSCKIRRDCCAGVDADLAGGRATMLPLPALPSPR